MSFVSRRLLLSLCGVLLVGALAPVMRADDAAKSDATGTWKWSIKGRNGESRDLVLKLKQDGEKLTGSLNAFKTDVDIQDGSIKDGAVSFKVTRKGKDDQEIVSTYSGTLSGDTIKGKIDTKYGDKSRSHEWEATRSKD